MPLPRGTRTSYARCFHKSRSSRKDSWPLKVLCRCPSSTGLVLPWRCSRTFWSFNLATALTQVDLQRVDPSSDATAPCRLAHELEEHVQYRVVLTTGGGLYRYQLGDAIEVVGFENQCPLIPFPRQGGPRQRLRAATGRTACSPRHWINCLPHAGFNPVLLCSRRATKRRDITACFCNSPIAQGNDLDLVSFRDRLRLLFVRESTLSIRRELGQLAPVAVTLLDPDAEPAARIFERQCLAHGQSLGNIKPTALDCWTGWAAAFDDAVQLAARSRRS